MDIEKRRYNRHIKGQLKQLLMDLRYFKITIPLLLYMICSLTMSCGKEDSFPPRYYNLQVEFISESGEDRLAGIPDLAKEVDRNFYEIYRTQYELETEQSGKPEEAFLLSPLYIQKFPEVNRLIIATSTMPDRPKYKPIRLTHRLVFPAVFDNEKEYQIISNWEYQPTEKVVSIEFEGKTYFPSEPDKNGYEVFTIVF